MVVAGIKLPLRKPGKARLGDSEASLLHLLGGDSEFLMGCPAGMLRKGATPLLWRRARSRPPVGRPIAA